MRWPGHPGPHGCCQKALHEHSACRNLPLRRLPLNLSHPLIRETSISSLRSSPSMIPPLSSTVFHVRPKSLRLILVVADAPILALPHGSFSSGVGPSTSRMASLVTP